NHSSKFQVLARIAKDILAIPASTIASESAFGAGRRGLDEKRSHLSSKSIKMCVCKKDWDQGKKRTQGLKDEEEDEDDPWMTMDTSDFGGYGDGGNQQQQQQQQQAP
ncbi:putative AC9 transposase, partial [Bienertia sinuspersici]